MSTDLSASADVILLSRRDFEHFLRILRDPPRPSPALIEAAEEYRKEIREGRLIVKD